jgi:hypothetical protein
VQHGSAYDRPSSASSENMVTYPEEMWFWIATVAHKNLQDLGCNAAVRVYTWAILESIRQAFRMSKTTWLCATKISSVQMACTVQLAELNNPGSNNFGKAY